MDCDKFSVSMCLYGGDNPQHFDEALASVVNQTVRPTEIVLVVDGPIADSTESVIQKYRDSIRESAFRVYYLEKNMGHGEARRRCFEECAYDLIALMDADDLAVPERFEKQLKCFETNPELSVVGGIICEFIGDKSNCVGKRIVPQTDHEIKEFMKKRCPMNQMTVMFKKKDVSAAGGYQDWYCDEDYYLWIRMAQKNMHFSNVEDTLGYVRVGNDMYQRRGGLKYFKSEAKLQKYMLDHRIIGFGTYMVNVTERLILQVVMPNNLRGWVFQKFARS